MPRTPTLSVAQFKVEFPEFATADNALVTAKLQDATDEIDPETWEEFTTQGVKYRTAHLMALTPQGRALRLVRDNGETVYGARFDQLQSAVAIGGIAV